jgi:hypothetical protein
MQRMTVDAFVHATARATGGGPLLSCGETLASNRAGMQILRQRPVDDQLRGARKLGGGQDGPCALSGKCLGPGWDPFDS